MSKELTIEKKSQKLSSYCDVNKDLTWFDVKKSCTFVENKD